MDRSSPSPSTTANRDEDNVGVMRLEHEGRPQSDGGLAAASNVNPEHPQPRDDLVPPGPGVAVNGAECSATPGIPQILGIPRLSSQLRIVENRAIIF